MSAVSYAALTTTFLQTQFAPLRHATKLLARVGGVSPRTAEAWLRGEHGPSGEALLNLMASNEELTAAVLAEVERRKREG